VYVTPVGATPLPAPCESGRPLTVPWTGVDATDHVSVSPVSGSVAASCESMLVAPASSETGRDVDAPASDEGAVDSRDPTAHCSVPRRLDGEQSLGRRHEGRRRTTSFGGSQTRPII
jgi:hypothetical protein